MWWQRGAVPTLAFNLRAANLHRTIFKNQLLCSTATRRSTLSSLLIKLGQHIRAGRDVTARSGDLWTRKMRWREHFTTPALQKTLNRHQPYFYTVIITQADRHTDGDQRRKRTKRKGKRTKRVNFPLKYISWRVMYPKTKTDTGCPLSPLSLLLPSSLSLTIFCGLILVNFLHFKSLDHSNGCWLYSILLDIKWSHLLVVLKISFKQDDGLHLSHTEYIQTCSSEIKQLRSHEIGWSIFTKMHTNCHFQYYNSS